MEKLIKKAWLTYAWVDNKTQVVQNIASHLSEHGIVCLLDIWNIQVGHRLWDQIDKHISDPEKSDAWLIYVTENTFNSQACTEEYYYALDRALHTRGDKFPVIAIFESNSIDRSLLPAGLKTRLHVTLTDPDWAERIASTINGTDLNINRPSINKYHLEGQIIDNRYQIDIFPTMGRWCPCFVGIPIDEKDELKPQICVVPRGVKNFSGICPGGSCIDRTGRLWMLYSTVAATPTDSIRLWTQNRFPTIIKFGVYTLKEEELGVQYSQQLKGVTW